MKTHIMAIATLLAVGACSGGNGALQDTQAGADLTAADGQADDLGTIDDRQTSETITDALEDGTPDQLAEIGPELVSDAMDAASDLGADTSQPPGCCLDSGHCGDGQVCAGSSGEEPGQCQPVPAAGQCYSNDDCPQWHFCLGAGTCGCDEDCWFHTGKCLPSDVGCCDGQGQCPEGASCVPEGPAGGTCMPAPSAGRCWHPDDCNVGQVCAGAYYCPCDADCSGQNRMGFCADPDLADCIEEHSGCHCEPGCMDGFGVTVYYPEDAGPFAGDMQPPPELLEVAVAQYECAICSCSEGWQIKVDGEWISPKNGPAGFCEHLKAVDAECGGCLEAWWGGCC